MAYLLGPQECNSDSTNFWIFSHEGLKRLIERTGWNILAFTTIGDTNRSTPADLNHDERALCVLKSNAAFELSACPNPVPASEKWAKQRFVGARWVGALAKSMFPLTDEKSLSLRADAKAARERRMQGENTVFHLSFE